MSEKQKQSDPDYSKMTDEELENLLDTSAQHAEADARGETVEEPEPESEKAEADSSETQEGDDTAEKADSAEQVEGGEEKAEPDVQQEIDPKDLELEELKLTLERTQAERRRQEYLSGRHAGELGHLKKQLAELRGSLTRRPQDDSEEAEETPVVPSTGRPSSRLEEEVAELRRREDARENESKQAALAEAYNQFLQDNKVSESDSATLVNQMKPHLDKLAESYRDVLGSLDARGVRKMSRWLLDEAYAETRLQDLQQRKAEALERKASQVSEKRQKKLAASPAGSGSAPAPKSKPKSIEDMTAEEADAELIRLYGDGTVRFRR